MRAKLVNLGTIKVAKPLDGARVLMWFQNRAQMK